MFLESNIARQLSTDSVSSLNSLSSACSLSSTPVTHEQEKKKKRGWVSNVSLSSKNGFPFILQLKVITLFCKKNL